nr:tetratricopeptide repeat-containing glycosyltransferase family protein [Kovacikia minuta]
MAASPEISEFHIDLGTFLQDQKQFELAIATYSQALEYHPNNINILFNLASSWRELEQFDTAINCYQRVLEIDPTFIDAHNNLALSFEENGQIETAISHLQQAATQNPDHAELQSNLGVMLYQKGDVKGAITHYQLAIAANPDFAEAHFNLSNALLAVGDFPKGFAEYEWRWRCASTQLPPLPGKRWDGRDLQGQKILLYAEQGFGDTIQFIRYASRVSQRNGEVMVACSKELVRLLTGIPDIQFTYQTDFFPDVDWHLPLLSLPFVLQEMPNQVPWQVPYLSPPEETTIFLEKPSSNGLKVGIVWSSGYRKTKGLLRIHKMKSIPLPTFMKFLSIPKVALYSLQVGLNSRDITQFGFEEQLQDLSPQLKDFADTAAVITQLDLVISVDTAVAHLAGALGKPVWVLLPFSADWRWMLEREDSPWYPTMRLFRQKQPGDWNGVLQQVSQSLLSPLNQTDL